MTLNDLWIKNNIESDTDIEILETNNPDQKAYYVLADDYERDYWNKVTDKKLESRVLMDSKVQQIIDKNMLTSFLNQHIDENSLMVLNHIAFIYETEEEESEIRENLENVYFDEYAREIGSDTLGITWVERQVVIINVSNILETSIDISEDPDEYHSADEIFIQGLCSTIFHECRHLLYECNELIDIGDDMEYPANGGLEDEVEEYGNKKMEQYINEFTKIINQHELSQMIKNFEYDDFVKDL